MCMNINNKIHFTARINEVMEFQFVLCDYPALQANGTEIRHPFIH